MCSRSSFSTQIVKYLCDLEPLAQHKHQILIYSIASHSTQTSNTHLVHRFSPNTKHQIIMCFRACTRHKHLINYVLQGPCPTHEIIYIKHMQLDFSQYIKQVIISMCSGVLYPIYKINMKATS